MTAQGPPRSVETGIQRGEADHETNQAVVSNRPVLIREVEYQFVGADEPKGKISAPADTGRG